MTFVGKVLVAVQLVLSVCFMAFAAAVFTAQTNWYAKSNAFEAQAKKAAQDQSDAAQAAQATLTERDATIAALNAEVALRSGKLTTAEESLQRLQIELQAARTAADTQTAVANLAADQETFRREEALRTRQHNDALHNQVNDLLAGNRGLEDELFAKNISIEQMKDRQQALIDRVGALTGRLRDIGDEANGGASAGGTQYTKNEPPNVTGQVLEVQKSPTSQSEFVVVSLGSDDGFRKGNELFVYRGDSYVGKIVLIDVTPDKAVGRVTQRNRNGVVQKGDHATPKL